MWGRPLQRLQIIHDHQVKKILYSNYINCAYYDASVFCDGAERGGIYKIHAQGMNFLWHQRHHHDHNAQWLSSSSLSSVIIGHLCWPQVGGSTCYSSELPAPAQANTRWATKSSSLAQGKLVWVKMDWFRFPFLAWLMDLVMILCSFMHPPNLMIFIP